MSEETTAIEEHFGNPAIYDINVEVSVVLGVAELKVHQLLKLGRGAVVELNRKTNEPVEMFVNDILIAKGDVIVTEKEKIGVTLTELIKGV